MKYHKISVFEHQQLCIGRQGFKQSHLDALLELNEYHDGNYSSQLLKE
jgi:5-methylcytosine-specific restriction enzyme subunit McrC